MSTRCGPTDGDGQHDTDCVCRAHSEQCCEIVSAALGRARLRSLLTSNTGLNTSTLTQVSDVERDGGAYTTVHVKVYADLPEGHG